MEPPPPSRTSPRPKTEVYPLKFLVGRGKPVTQNSYSRKYKSFFHVPKKRKFIDVTKNVEKEIRSDTTYQN